MFHHYAQLTQEMVSNPQAITVIPLAAMEAHGPHLPLGTDGIIVDGILDHAAALDQSAHAVYRLPTLWLGASEEHVDHPGTLSLNAEQMISQIVAIGEGLAHCGLRRVMLFNAHGGNVAAAAAKAMNEIESTLDAAVGLDDHGLTITPSSPLPPSPPAQCSL
jgi:creatinine amidohydrolase